MHDFKAKIRHDVIHINDNHTCFALKYGYFDDSHQFKCKQR